MKPRNESRPSRRVLSTVALGASVFWTLNPVVASAQASATATPIKHVIIIIGENRSFDHIFATYRPVDRDETVDNLLSRRIVNPDGTPGPNYGAALQNQAVNTYQYDFRPPKTPYAFLPPALTGGPSTPAVCQAAGASGTDCSTNPAALALAAGVENGLPGDYAKYLLTGGTGQPSHVPDARISYAGRDASHLPPGPFQITSPSFPYDAYAASPVHRFYQMWQQLDCAPKTRFLPVSFGGQADRSCSADLFAWVEVSVGGGSNGKAPPANFTDESTGEGSTAMGFYNVQQGDAPYLKYLADTYAMSDNFHQAGSGGTGLNHLLLGFGTSLWFSDGNGHPAVPPHRAVDPANPTVPANGNPDSLDEIENPNPQPGTNNYYIQDGYGGGSGAVGAAGNYGGGSYSKCADGAQPGVGAVRRLLAQSEPRVPAGCEPERYYLLNNYNPGYFGDGTNAYADANPKNSVFTIPPTTQRSIGDLMNARNVSWAYYGDQWNLYLQDKYQQNRADAYCNICNWAQYETAIMTDPAQRTAHLKDTTDLYAAIADGTLPAVSYVKPSGLVDGHPASSKLNLFEGFTKKIVDAVKANPKLWEDTAILVTFDEGGGYYDSGYVQPVDFFGDGTRIPLIVVSKYTMGGHISHDYADHVSITKFIEANWHLDTITDRTRDTLPNPRHSRSNRYVPENRPAIGDLMDFFRHHRDRS